MSKVEGPESGRRNERDIELRQRAREERQIVQSENHLVGQKRLQLVRQQLAKVLSL